MGPGGTGFRGLGIIEAASGALVASLDFGVSVYLDGPGGGPVWLNDHEALVTEIAGGSPTILGVDGSVTSALDRFRMSDFIAEANADGTAEDSGWEQMVRLGVHLPANGDSFHVITEASVPDTDGSSHILIYHSELDTVELIAASDVTNADVPRDGLLALYENWSDKARLVRNFDPPGSPAIKTQVDSCAGLRVLTSAPPANELRYSTESEAGDEVAIYRWPECDDPVMTLHVTGLPTEPILSVSASPDRRWLAIFVGHTYPSRALYLAAVDLGEITPATVAAP